MKNKTEEALGMDKNFIKRLQAKALWTKEQKKNYEKDFWKTYREEQKKAIMSNDEKIYQKFQRKDIKLAKEFNEKIQNEN